MRKIEFGLGFFFGGGLVIVDEELDLLHNL